MRPVSVADAFRNIFERLILYEINKEIVLEDNQFGFRFNSSCNHAIFTLNEAISKAKQMNKKKHMVAADARQAFDKIKREYLYCIMIKMRISSHIIYIIMAYYANSWSIVRNEDKLFKTTRGSKQGGLLSPTFFFYLRK